MPATCTTDGNIEYWYCTVCQKYFSDAQGTTEIAAADIVVPAAHTLEHVEASPATCTAAGNIEYWYCTACQKYFSDAQGATEITQAATVVDATGHTMQHTVASPAGCTTEGNIEYWYCTACQKYFSDDQGAT